MSLGDPLDIRPIARADYGEALSTEGDHREQEVRYSRWFGVPVQTTPTKRRF